MSTMSERFEHHHDLSTPPDVVRWDLDERPAVHRSTEKICAVRVGRHVYGIAERHVRGLRQVKSVAPVPLTPDFLLGVTAIAGAIVPLIDLPSALDLGQADAAGPWTALLVEAEKMTVLLAVEEVVAFEKAETEDTTATSAPDAADRSLDGGVEPAGLDPSQDPTQDPPAWTSGKAPILGRPVPLLDLPHLLSSLRRQITSGKDGAWRDEK